MRAIKIAINSGMILVVVFTVLYLVNNINTIP